MLSSRGLGRFEGMTELVWYMGFVEKPGEALRIGPFGMIICCGFANCELNWAGLPMNVEGSIMAPATAEGSLS